YPPALKFPYRERREAFGKERYGELGISREDVEGRQRAAAANWDCFGAPAALFCYIDRDLGPPQWADVIDTTARRSPHAVQGIWPPVLFLMERDDRQKVLERIDQGVERRIVGWCGPRFDERSVGCRIGRRHDPCQIAESEEKRSDGDESRHPPEGAERSIPVSDGHLEQAIPDPERAADSRSGDPQTTRSDLSLHLGIGMQPSDKFCSDAPLGSPILPVRRVIGVIVADL